MTMGWIRENHSLMSFFKGAALIILLIGLAVRLILMPLFTYPFDIEHWAVIFQNTESGNGLFGLTGYFYTPVWGYLLGFEDLIYQTFSFIDSYGRRFTDLLPIEHLGDRFYTATTTSPEFNIAMKIPLILCDIAVGYLIYDLVFKKTNDTKKSTMAFGFWFLCPIVIYESAVQAMFDCYSALFMLLTILLLLEDRHFFAGCTFTLAALIKFFPFFCISILVAYIFKKHGIQKGLRYVLLSAAGAIIAAIIIFLPTVLDGTFENAFSFVFDRAGSMDLISTINTYVYVGATVAELIVFPILMIKTKTEDTDKHLILFSLISLITISTMSLGPQYCIVYIPLLSIYLADLDFSGMFKNIKNHLTPIIMILLSLLFLIIPHPYYLIVAVVALLYFMKKGSTGTILTCLIVITVTSTISGFFNNSLSILTPTGAFWGLFDPVAAINQMRDWEGISIAGFNFPSFMVAYSEKLKLLFCLILIAVLLKKATHMVNIHEIMKGGEQH